MATETVSSAGSLQQRRYFFMMQATKTSTGIVTVSLNGEGKVMIQQAVKKQEPGRRSNPFVT
ncbi:MAG: hypothetical protein AABY78_06770 [Nitrospirota bacterium]